jgi:hypothetical protein
MRSVSLSIITFNKPFVSPAVLARGTLLAGILATIISKPCWRAACSVQACLLAIPGACAKRGILGPMRQRFSILYLSALLALTAICGLLIFAAAAGSVSAQEQPVENDTQVQSLAKEPIRDKWALVIGISHFKDSSLDLKFPAKDASDFCNFLITKGNFARDHVRLLVNEQASRERILDELGDKWLPRVAMPGDLVVIYLSTHGSPSEMDLGGVNYVVAYDTSKDRLYATGIAMQDLCRIVKARVHSNRTLIIMDACHSGATSPDGKGLMRAANVDAEAVAQGTGQMVICSSQPSETSWESKSAMNSVFTKRLLEGLALKGPGTTLAEAFGYVKESVQQDVLRERGQMQTPVLKSKWQGDDLKLSISPISPRQALIDGDQQSADPANPVIPLASDPKPSVLRLEQNRSSARAVNVVPAPSSASGVHLHEPGSFAQEAEKALRDHFLRMAYGSPAAAYSDFTDSVKHKTPFARYEVNVRKQKYVPAVQHMPAQAFKTVSASENRAIILVNEQWITGQNVLWRYSLLRANGSWLIDGFKIITKDDWANAL